MNSLNVPRIAVLNPAPLGGYSAYLGNSRRHRDNWDLVISLAVAYRRIISRRRNGSACHVSKVILVLIMASVSCSFWVKGCHRTMCRRTCG